MKSWLTLFSLLAFVSSLLTTGSGQKVNYKIIGADFVLIPPSPPTSPVTSVLWKHNGDLAVEWEGEPATTEYSHFKGHSYLNHDNGELTLKNLNDKFSGEYAVEINNYLIPGSINLKVISPVPKPHISMSCTTEKTKCTLTCEGNVADMDPKPTYIWKFNNTEHTHLSQNLDITPESTAPEFICELKNPVSHESSEVFANPFSPSPVDGLKINAGLIVFICLAAVVLGLVLIHKVKSGTWFFLKDSMPWQADFWQKTESQAPTEYSPANDEPERNTSQ